MVFTTSVLGPSLFVYFMNGIPEILKCFIKIFADDTKEYTAMQSDKHRRLPQNNIDQLVQWTKDWQIKFSNDQCKSFHIGQNNPEQIFIFYGWQGASVYSHTSLETTH